MKTEIDERFEDWFQKKYAPHAENFAGKWHVKEAWQASQQALLEKMPNDDMIKEKASWCVDKETQRGFENGARWFRYCITRALEG